MGILSALPVIGKAVDKGLDVVDQIVEDKDQAARLKTEIRTQIEAQAHSERQALIKEQGKIVGLEVQGESWLQRNWRPLLMLCVIAIIFNNYVLVPYLSLFTDKVAILELPNGLWALLNVGVGGYVAGRSGEKIVQNLKGKDNG
jgi:uncharacterized membrane protein